MYRWTWKLVSRAISVVMGREQVTTAPSLTSRVAWTLFVGVMKFSVPSSSSAPSAPSC